MNALADQDVVLLAGPLAGSEQGRLRALLIVEADSEAEIHHRLNLDPWARTELLVTNGIEPWTILAGAQRLARTNDARL